MVHLAGPFGRNERLLVLSHQQVHPEGKEPSEIGFLVAANILRRHFVCELVQHHPRRTKT